MTTRLTYKTRANARFPQQAVDIVSELCSALRARLGYRRIFYVQLPPALYDMAVVSEDETAFERDGVVIVFEENDELAADLLTIHGSYAVAMDDDDEARAPLY